jgi:hypothetical protein
MKSVSNYSNVSTTSKKLNIKVYIDQTSTTNTTITTNTTSSTPKFFVDHKKGEVNELMTLLKNPNIDKDINKKKDIIKRVIAYMTLGVDVSKLFHEMVKVKILH